MTIFDNIFDILLPDYLVHGLLEFADRLKTQHFIIFCLAVGTLGFNAQVGQAGIGTINQAQVSCHCPVPQYAVIAQPQMLFLVLDQHFNRPTFEIVVHNGFHRSSNTAGDKSDTILVSSTTREDNLNITKSFNESDTLGKAIASGCSQAGNGIPSAAVIENISAVLTQLM